MADIKDENHVERFNHLSKNYVEDLNHTLRYTGGDSQYFYSMKMRLIKMNLKKDPKVILDFGCASGNFTRMLHREFPNSNVIGYDPATECIAEARRQAPQSPLLEFASDLAKLPVHPDLVVASGVFHHIPVQDRQGVCDDIFKLMGPASRFFIFEHNPLNPVTQIIVKNAPVDQGAVLIRKGQGLQMLKNSGFKDLQGQFIGFVPPILRGLLPLENLLGWLPIGAQFMLIADR